MIEYTFNQPKRGRLEVLPIEPQWIDERLVVCFVPVSRTYVELWPEEAALIEDSTLRRRAEFAAGRNAARKAMVALGRPVSSIGRGADGEPVFPAGLRGSISHTNVHAVALMGLAADYLAVGVDVDDMRPLGDAAAAGVTWKSEVRRIQHAMRLTERDAAQNFAFSAKEAIFKCQFSLTQDATLKAHQALLSAAPYHADGEMVVSGWRVARSTASVLNLVRIRRTEFDGTTLAVATIAAAT